MSPIHVADESLDASFEQSVREKLAKLLRKLRWCGFEKDADRIQCILAGAAPDQSALVCRIADLRILQVVVKILSEYQGQRQVERRPKRVGVPS